MNKEIDLVLFAGGYAGSLRPITEYMPKAMLPLGNKFLIQRIIEELIATCPIGKIYIIANYFSELIFEYARLLKKANVIKNDIIYVEMPKTYNTGGILLKIKDSISEDFLLYYSDVLPVNLNYSSLLKLHFRESDDILGTLVTSRIYHVETGYVDVDSNGYVSSFVEKPQKDQNIKNMAIVIIKSRIIDYIKNRNDNFFKDVFTAAIKEGEVFKNFDHNADWHHFQHISKYHYEHVLNYEKWLKK